MWRAHENIITGRDGVTNTQQRLLITQAMPIVFVWNNKFSFSWDQVFKMNIYTFLFCSVFVSLHFMRPRFLLIMNVQWQAGASYHVGGHSCSVKKPPASSTKATYSCCWKISHMLSVETQGMTVGASKDIQTKKRRRGKRKKGSLLLLSIQAEWFFCKEERSFTWCLGVHTIMRTDCTAPTLIP